MTRHWGYILAAAFAVAFLGFVGPADYADQMATAAAVDLQRAQVAAMEPVVEVFALRPEHQIERECRRQRRQFVLAQNDGGAWWGMCIDNDYRGKKR